jgi:hypothetical protein
MGDTRRKHEPAPRLPVRTAGPLRVRPEGQSAGGAGEAPRRAERRDIASRQRLLQRIELD